MRVKINNRIFRLIILSSFSLSPLISAGQNIGISTTGATPNSSALLDIDASPGNNKGLLIPRMTTAQRNAIASPAHSLLIYNTTTDCFEAWNNTTSNWVAFGCIGCQLPGSFSATAATNIAPTAFDANWTASAGATTYYLDVATDAGFTSFVTGYINLNVGNVVTYSVNTNLTCATIYYYRVRADNSCGTSANSNTITVTTSSCCTVDFEEHFTYATQAAADAVWPTTDPTTYRVDIGTGDLHINSFLSSTITSTSHDLGAGNVSNTQWLLRMKVTTISWVCYSSGGWADHPGMGITDRDYNSGANYNGPAQDGIGAGQSTNPCAWGHGTMYGDNSCCVFTSCCNTALNITPSGTRYLEIVRLSATSMKVTWYSDATYTTVVGTATETGVPATIQNLRYIKFSDDGGPTFGSGSGSWDYRVDDIYFWNNRTTPCP